MESEDSSFRPMLLWGPQLSPRTGWVPSTQHQHSQVQGPGPRTAPRCPAVHGSQGGGTHRLSSAGRFVFSPSRAAEFKAYPKEKRNRLNARASLPSPILFGGLCRTISSF